MHFFWFRLRSYLSYRLWAKGSHSLHSPFLFDLYNKAIRPSRNFRLENVEKLRDELKKDHQIIDLYDLKTKENYRRTIGSIAKTSLSTRRFSAFLHLLICEQGYEKILETGTSLGINSLYLAGPDNVRKVATLEASSVIASIAKKQFNKLLQHKIEIKVGTLQDELESLLVKEQPDLCFIDADHRSEAVLKCVNLIMTHCPNIECIVIHDIYWSADMLAGWDTVVSDARFPLTIDIFEAGIIFPQKKMEKQHFTLRF
ncbi:MAG: class I SAM-dependent methyltransferase [Ekhidna sp.]|uniref:class I SAM-dependent methyltransferase n=1 Tax=Ekhidna sp. TaxID=2608089 RepID=UPI0032EB1BA2